MDLELKNYISKFVDFLSNEYKNNFKYFRILNDSITIRAVPKKRTQREIPEIERILKIAGFSYEYNFIDLDIIPISSIEYDNTIDSFIICHDYKITNKINKNIDITEVIK